MRQLMRDNNLEQWEFKFDLAKKRLGGCHHGKMLISLSKSFVELNEESVVKNTMLHELAHAIIPSYHGHDKVWERKFIELGGKMRTHADYRKIIKPLPKWKVSCDSCPRNSEAHRRNRNLICGGCYRRGHHGNLIWKENK